MKFCVQGCFRVELLKIMSIFLQKFSLRDTAGNLNLLDENAELVEIIIFIYQSIGNDETNLNFVSN